MFTISYLDTITCAHSYILKARPTSILCYCSGWRTLPVEQTKTPPSASQFPQLLINSSPTIDQHHEARGFATKSTNPTAGLNAQMETGVDRHKLVQDMRRRAASRSQTFSMGVLPKTKEIMNSASRVYHFYGGIWWIARLNMVVSYNRGTHKSSNIGGHFSNKPSILRGRKTPISPNQEWSKWCAMPQPWPPSKMALPGYHWAFPWSHP